MSTKPYQGSFHFVNKNGSNLTRRDADESFRISSHVTNKYYQWAKRARGKHQIDNYCHQSAAHRLRKRHIAQETPQSETSTPLSGARGDSGQDENNQGFNSRTICWQLGSGANTSARMSTSPRDSPEPISQPCADIQIDERYFLPELWPEDLPDEHTLTLSKQFDFKAPDWAACPHFQKEALEVFRGMFLSFGYTDIQQANYRQSMDIAWHRQVTELVTDRKSLHGWYASVLTLKALYMQPEFFSFLYPMALSHQNRSLMLLREHMREDAGHPKSMLLCIWTIVVTASYSDDIKENLAHAPVIWEIVDRLGGINALDPATRARVLLLHNFHSRFTLTRPRLHYSLFDPGAFQEQPGFAQHSSLVSDMEGQFRRWDEAFLLPEDALSDDLHNYIMAHREFMSGYTLAAELLSGSEPDTADAMIRWLRLRRAALGSWTMELYCDIVETITPQTRMSRCVRRQLQACVCLAVSYGMSFVYGFALPLHKWLLYTPIQNLRPQMQILLDLMSKRGTLPSVFSATINTSCKVPLAITHHEVLLFLFFVGACAEQVSDEAGKRPELLVDRRWHSTRFCEMTKILGLRTWKETKKILLRFLYDDGVVMDRFVEGLFELRNELTDKGSVLGAG